MLSGKTQLIGCNSGISIDRRLDVLENLTIFYVEIFCNFSVPVGYNVQKEYSMETFFFSFAKYIQHER